MKTVQTLAKESNILEVVNKIPQLVGWWEWWEWFHEGCHILREWYIMELQVFSFCYAFMNG